MAECLSFISIQYWEAEAVVFPSIAKVKRANKVLSFRSFSCKITLCLLANEKFCKAPWFHCDPRYTHNLDYICREGANFPEFAFGSWAPWSLVFFFFYKNRILKFKNFWKKKLHMNLGMYIHLCKFSWWNTLWFKLHTQKKMMSLYHVYYFHYKSLWFYFFIQLTPKRIWSWNFTEI